MRILVVEDEPKTGEYLKRGLDESGFLTDLASNGAEGLHLAVERDYDAVVLDIILPGLDGWQVLEQLRRKKKTPVLFLTARDALEDRVKGLELGADDYLVKPFAFIELLARLRCSLRHGAAREPERLQVGDLELDLLTRRVIRAGHRIDLSAKEFALLHLLMKRRGEVLSRSMIASEVWDMNCHIDTNVVDVAIRRLRAKVDDPYEKKLIHTVRGMGYSVKERD